MKAASLLVWTTAALLLVGTAEAFFKKWKNVPLPPGECVLSFDYCKIGCSYCTRCYVNFIDCALKPRASPDDIRRKNRTDICITALDKCKGSCTDCTPCYTMFIDCKQQMNKNGTAPLVAPVAHVAVNKTTPDNAAKNAFGQETKINAGKENANGGFSGKVNSLEESVIDIAMPGIPVFLVDKSKFPGLSRSDMNEFYDAAVEITELLRSYGVHDDAERWTGYDLDLPLEQEDMEARSRANHYIEDLENSSIFEKLSEQYDESMIKHQDYFDSETTRVKLAPAPVVDLEINDDAPEQIPSGTESRGHIDDSLFHEAESVLLVQNDDDGLVLGTEMPAADLPGTEMPAADLPGTEMPAADLPGTEMPAADLPGTEMPAADLPGTEMPAADLTGTEMPAADLTGTEMPAADLTGTEMPAADLTGTEMPAADLLGTEKPAADLPGTEMPAADLAGTEKSAADLAGTEKPAADLAGTEMPAADLPGTEMPAADLSQNDKPVGDAEFQGANVRFPQVSEQHENLNIAFEDPYHIDPRLVR